MPVDQTTPSRVQRAQSFKQSAKKHHKENIVIDIQMLSKEAKMWPSCAKRGWRRPGLRLMIAARPSTVTPSEWHLFFDQSTAVPTCKTLKRWLKMLVQKHKTSTNAMKICGSASLLIDSALVMPTFHQLTSIFDTYRTILSSICMDWW